MKNIILIMAYLVAGNSIASEVSVLAPLRTHRTELCNYWSYARTDTNSGYLCRSMGSYVELPDAASVSSSLNELETRILVLESQLQRLQKQCETK